MKEMIHRPANMADIDIWRPLGPVISPQARRSGEPSTLQLIIVNQIVTSSIQH